MQTEIFITNLTLKKLNQASFWLWVAQQTFVLRKQNWTETNFLASNWKDVKQLRGRASGALNSYLINLNNASAINHNSTGFNHIHDREYYRKNLLFLAGAQLNDQLVRPKPKSLNYTQTDRISKTIEHPRDEIPRNKYLEGVSAPSPIISSQPSTTGRNLLSSSSLVGWVWTGNRYKLNRNQMGWGFACGRTREGDSSSRRRSYNDTDPTRPSNPIRVVASMEKIIWTAFFFCLDMTLIIISYYYKLNITYYKKPKKPKWTVELNQIELKIIEQLKPTR